MNSGSMFHGRRRTKENENGIARVQSIEGSVRLTYMLSAPTPTPYGIRTAAARRRR
jgi:hypothetical protein